jgi:Holliday junction resolvasome RuvABC endonuclease subunit
VILGIDPGYAKCGWAVVEPVTARVIDLGLITTMKRAGLHVSADRASRVSELCDKIAELAHKHGATTIGAEQALTFGAPAAIAANCLPWGAIVMLARMINVALLEVSANDWQCAVLGLDPKVKHKFKRGEKYARVEKALYAYVGTQLADALDGLNAKDRRHPLDATGSGMFAALMPAQATRIIKRREQAA